MAGIRSITPPRAISESAIHSFNDSFMLNHARKSDFSIAKVEASERAEARAARLAASSGSGPDTASGGVNVNGVAGASAEVTAPMVGSGARPAAGSESASEASAVAGASAEVTAPMVGSGARPAAGSEGACEASAVAMTSGEGNANRDGGATAEVPGSGAAPVASLKGATEASGGNTVVGKDT